MNVPKVYEVVVESYLGSDWSYRFEGLTFKHGRDGQTVISGPALDQSALPPLLGKILDFNLKLIAVRLANGEPMG